MSGPPISDYEALDVGAQITHRGYKGVLTVLTREGLVTISMNRAITEGLRHSIERELQQNPLPAADVDREIGSTCCASSAPNAGAPADTGSLTCSRDTAGTKRCPPLLST